MPSNKTGHSKVKKDSRTSQTPRGTTQTSKGSSSGSSSGSKPQSTSTSKQNISLPTATQNLKTTTAQSILNNAAASAVKQNDTARAGINMAPPTSGKGFGDGRLSGTNTVTGKNTFSYTDSKGDKHTTKAGGLGTMNPLEALQAAAYMRNSTNQTASELRSTASRMDDNSAGRQKLMDTAGFVRNLSQYDQKLPDEQRNAIVRTKNLWNAAQDGIDKFEQWKTQYAAYGLDTTEIDQAIAQLKAYQRHQHDVADANRAYSGYTGGAKGDRFDKWNLSQEYTDISSDNPYWTPSKRAAAGNDTFDIEAYKQAGVDRDKWIDPTWQLKDSLANEEAYAAQLRKMGEGYVANLLDKEVAETAAKQANPASWDVRVEDMLKSAGNRVGGSLLSFGSLASQATENTIANSNGRAGDIKAMIREAEGKKRHAEWIGDEDEAAKWQKIIDNYMVSLYGGQKYEPGTEGTLSESYINRAIADDPGTSEKGAAMLEKSRQQLAQAQRGLGYYGRFATETAGVGLENIPTMALYALNPVAGAAYMAATVLGEKGDEFSRDMFGAPAYSAQEALLKAAPYAAVETATEAVGDSRILGYIRDRGSLGLSGIASRSFLTEGAEEGLAGGLDYGLDYLYGNPAVKEYSPGRVLSDIAKESLQGGIIGAISGVGGSVIADNIGSEQDNLDPEWWKNVDTSPMQNYTDRFRANRMVPGNADYIEMMQYLQEQAGRRNAEALGSNYTEEAPVRYDPRTWGQDMNILVDMYREGGITDREWRELAYDDALVSMIEDTAERKMTTGSRVAWVQKTIGELANIQAEYNNGRTIERSGRYAHVRNASNESMDAAGDILRNETGKKGGIRKNGKADNIISQVKGVVDVSDIEKRAAALAGNESTETGADIVSMANGVRKPASVRMEEENGVSEPVDIRRMVKPAKADEASFDGDIMDYEYTDADVPAENNDTRTADDMAEDTYEGMSDEGIADVLNSIYREQIDAGDPAVDETENAADIIRNVLPEMDEATEREVMTGVIDAIESMSQEDGIPWSKTDIEKFAKRAYNDIVRNRENEQKEAPAVSEQQEESEGEKPKYSKIDKHISYSELDTDIASVVDKLYQYAVDNKTVEGLEELGKDKANWAAAQEIIDDYFDEAPEEYNYRKHSLEGAMYRLSELIGIKTKKGKNKFYRDFGRILPDLLYERHNRNKNGAKNPRASLESAIRAAHEGITDEQLAEVMGYVSDDMLNSKPTADIVKMLEPGIKGVMAAGETEAEQETQEQPEVQEQEPVLKAPKPGPFTEQSWHLTPSFLNREFNGASAYIRNEVYQLYQETLYEYDQMLRKGVAKWETAEKRLSDIAKRIEQVQKDEINNPRMQALHGFLRNRGLRLTEEDIRSTADLDKVKAEYRDSKRLKITEADYKRDSDGNKVYYRGGDTGKKGHRTPNVDVYWEELISEFNDIGIVSAYAQAVEKNEEDVVSSILAICDASWAAKDNFVSADTILSGLVEGYVANSTYIEKFGDRYGYEDHDELPFDKVSEKPQKPKQKKQKKQPKAENKPKEPEKQNGPGLVVDDYVSANVSRAEQKRLDESAKALGITVRFADEVNGGESNAQYENGVVTIEKNNPNPTLFLYGHEITHHLEDTAPDAHNRLKNYLKNQSDYRKRLTDMKELYRSNGYQVTDEYLENEVIADMTGDLINNEDILQRFIKANRKNQTFLQKLFSAFRSLLAKLGGTGRSREVAKACRMIEDAIDASIEKEFKKRGGVRNSVKFDYFPYQTYMFKNERYDGDSPLVAVRGTSTDGLKQALSSGFFVAPSIAVTTPELSIKNDFGNNYVFFPRHVIDPQEHPENTVFQQDAYTSTYPRGDAFINPETGEGFENVDKALSIMMGNGLMGESNFSHAIDLYITTFKTVDEIRRYNDYIRRENSDVFDEIMSDNADNVYEFIKSLRKSNREIAESDYFRYAKLERYIDILIFANASGELFRQSMEGLGFKITDSDTERWKKLLDEQKKLPTEYREAKPFQLIPTYKMNAAVLDGNFADDEIVKSLEEMDVRVFLYETEEEKKKAFEKALEVPGVRFSLKNNSDRGSLKTSQFKQWGITDSEVTRNPDNRKTGTTITEIVDWVRTQMGVQVNSGHMGGKPKTVRGFYQPNDQSIRTRINNYLPTITHELGHWLDDMTSRKTGGKFGDFTNSLSEQARKELVENTDVDQRYNKNNKRLLVMEGFAEFIREFLKSKGSAQAKFPTVYKELYNSLDMRDAQTLDVLADMVNDYQTSEADLSTVVRRQSEITDTRTPQQKVYDRAEQFYQDWVDSNHAIDVLTRETGDRMPYMKATNAAYAAQRAGAIITSNMFSLDGTTYIGPSLKHALKGAGLDLGTKKGRAEYDDFGVYLVAKHGPERLRLGAEKEKGNKKRYKRAGQGRVTADDRMNNIKFLDKTAADLEKKYPHFKAAAEALYRFQTDFLYEYAVASGMVSKKAADEWTKQWKFYVPFQRYMGDDKATATAANRKFANQTNGIYKFKGSGRDIIHPVDSVMGFVTRMATVAIMNDTMLTLTASAERNGLTATWMTRIADPLKETKVKTDAFKKKVLKFIESEIDLDGWTDEERDEFTDGLKKLDSTISAYSTIDPSGDIVTVYRNGKPEFWQVKDKRLLQSLQSMGTKQIEGLSAAWAVITRFMTSNITGRNVIWAIMSNMPRDAITQLVLSEKHNPVDLLSGMKDNFFSRLAGDTANNRYFHEYIAMGGGQTTSYNYDINNTDKLIKHMGKAVNNPLEALDFVSAIVESGPRFAEYQSRRKRGQSPHEAFYAAMDVTTNFARHGANSRDTNRMVPFFNASVQGIDRFSRWIRATDVEGTKADRQKASLGRTAVWASASLVIAALIYAWNNSDDDKKEDYQMLSEYTKNTYFSFARGNGTYITIPKPREIAVLESLFERAMERADGGNEEAFKGFFDYATDNFLPPVIAPLVQGDINGVLSDFGILGAISTVNSNKDFLGNPIESQSFESSNTPINERMNSQTSLMAKWISGALYDNGMLPEKLRENLSPVKIDYFCKQVFGGFWKTPASFFPSGEEYFEDGIPNYLIEGFGRVFMGQYTKDSLYSTDIINWMYDYKTEQSRKSNGGTGDFDAEFNAKLAERYTDFYGKFYKLTKSASTSDEVRAMREQVLDTMVQFKKQAENDAFPEYIEQLRQVAKDQSDKSIGDLMPSVFEREIKDADGKKHLLTGAQYYELQTRYNGYYAEAVQQILANDEASANEKAAAIDSMKDDISARAKKEILEMIGAPTSATKTSAAGNESTTYIDKFSQYYESGKISSGEMAGLRMTVNAQKSNYLPEGKTQDLSESYHKAKAIADYGLNLSTEETMELMQTFGIESEEVLQNYKNGMLDEIVKNLDDGCAMAWENYNASNGG